MKLTRREFARLSGLAAAGLGAADLSWAFPQNAATRSSSGKRVVVLGAGMAGLVAGWELRKAGHDVTILEAQLHPGGRVHTIREGLSDYLYAEAGAGRIPETHSVTMEWVDYFRLELEPFYPSDGAEVAVLKGKRVKIPANGPLDMSQVPLNLTVDERKLGLGSLFAHYCSEILRKEGDHIREDWPPEIVRLEDITIADYLRQRGASEDAIHYMLIGFDDNAAADYLKDFLNEHAPLNKIKGGNDQLPRAFAAELKDIIRYGCAVEHIERGESRVRISCRRAGTLDQLDADAVVCTIPYSVLRHIPVTPEWSPAKRKVIDSTYYGPCVRTTFQVSRRYWEDEGMNGFGTSDKNFEVWHPTYGKPGRRGLLQAYNYERYADHLDQLGEADRIEQEIRDMEEVHPGLRTHLEGLVVKSWALDPWQRGAYTLYNVGQLEFYADICRPEGQIWFAGEHASPYPGWIQGALMSGIKAAKEINAT